MGSKELDIILATHNNLGMTIWCIEHLYRNTSIPFRLVVVDDSTDLTPTWLNWWRAQGHENIELIRPAEALTCGNQIINIGLKNTDTEFVAYLGNSTHVQPEWLDAAWHIIHQHEKIGVIGFKLLKPSGVIEHAGICFTPEMPHHMNYGVGDPPHDFTHIKEIGIVGWALVLLRRKAIPEGGLDEKTYYGFRGYDDLDNCLTMQKNGWQVLYSGLGCAVHHALSTRGDMSDKSMQEYEENRRRFTVKWGDVERQVQLMYGKPTFVG